MKKKIIIFTTAGGNGHISATKALSSYLSDEYEIMPVFIFEEVLKKIDPVALLTFGKLTGPEVYNFFTRHGNYKMLNFIYKFGNWYSRHRIKSMSALINNYLAHNKPDLVISVIPFVNDTILKVAEKNNIPLLLIPTDFDVTTFIVGINNPQYPKFITTLGADDPLIKTRIEPTHMNEKQIAITGLPIRKDFFEVNDKNKELLKRQYGIENNKPVIVLMKGGQVKPTILAFAKELTKLSFPAHLIFCVSNNEKIRKRIQELTFPSHISVTILGFTEHISELFAMADLLITKSGSASLAEGIAMNVPMILDATETLLYWERLNHTLLTTHHWGISLKNIKGLNSAIIQILGDPTHYQQIKRNLEAFDKPRLDLEIKPIIERLL